MTASLVARLVKLLAALFVFALIAAACGSSDDNATPDDDAESQQVQSDDEPDDPGPDDTVVVAAPADEIDNAIDLEAYVADAAAVAQPDSDAGVPPDVEAFPSGAPGFTRYVFRDNGKEVIPTLVEGPLGQQVRCQSIDLPCSYVELKELAESGAPIPDELDLTEDELTALVGELDALNATMERYNDVDDACADGYVSDRIQSANMGSHFYLPRALGNGFDPAEPEILLYALADGSTARGPLGQCRSGVWDGPPVKVVGTAFILTPTIVGNDHPEGFTGDFDNWHIHYNLCRGNSQGRDQFVPREDCEAGGGNFAPAIGWMMHAWADPDHDNQMGVFSMWNPSIAPVTDPEVIEGTRVVRSGDLPEGSTVSNITNFAFDELEVGVGETIVFSNTDSAAHTVTGGPDGDPDGSFDSGVFAPGEAFEWTPDEAGSYDFFCALHPGMVGTVSVS